MSDNPYQAPTTRSEPEKEVYPARDGARLAWRTVMLILLLPAVFNFLAFDHKYVAGGPFSVRLELIYRATNTLGFVLGGAFLWWCGLSILERLSEWLRKLVAPHVHAYAWNHALYDALERAVYCALPGAMLWAGWVWGFYYAAYDYALITWLVGIPGHILGACVYGPMVYRWYRLRAAV